MKKLLLAAATAGVLALFSEFTPVQAQTTPSDQVLFGITLFQNELIRVDTTTGDGTLVGDIDAQESGYGLATYNGNLYTFNPNRGSIDELSKIDGRVLSSVPFSVAKLSGEGDIEIGPTGVGYLASAFDSTGAPTHPFYSFNVNTGVATFVGNTSVVIDGLALSGGTLPITLYAIGQGEATSGNPGSINPPVPELYKVDPITAMLTPVGPLGVDENSPIAGLGFAPDGTLYAAIDDKLYTVNLSTGAATIVNADTTYFGFNSVSGLTYASGASVLGNLSSRAQVLAGNDPLITGFTVGAETGGTPVGGTAATKMVVIRGIGPSLADSGVQGELMNPILTLFNSSGTKIAANDNWQQNSAADRAVITSNGLAPSNPMESVIVANLPAGQYTAMLRGVNNGTGIGLADIYDVNEGNGLKATNLSARAMVAPGDDALISGMIVEGSAARRTLIRGLGPSLAQEGVSNPLADPELMAYDANGNLLETNDSWMTSPQVADIKASGLAPDNPKEAVIDRVFQPGAYTFVLTGVGSDNTGTALIEAYDRNSSD